MHSGYSHTEDEADQSNAAYSGTEDEVRRAGFADELVGVVHHFVTDLIGYTMVLSSLHCHVRSGSCCLLRDREGSS